MATSWIRGVRQRARLPTPSSGAGGLRDSLEAEAFPQMAGRSCEAGRRTVTTWSSSTAHTTQAAHPSWVFCQLITSASTSAAPGRRRAHACRVRERAGGTEGSDRAAWDGGMSDPRSRRGTPEPRRPYMPPAMTSRYRTLVLPAILWPRLLRQLGRGLLRRPRRRTRRAAAVQLGQPVCFATRVAIRLRHSWPQSGQRQTTMVLEWVRTRCVGGARQVPFNVARPAGLPSLAGDCWQSAVDNRGHPQLEPSGGTPHSRLSPREPP